MKVSNKKNLYVADEDLQWFEKAKDLFPNVSVSKLIAEVLKERCLLKEAEQKNMVEQIVSRGKHYLVDDIFLGQESRFDGIMLATGSDTAKTVFKIYLTKKDRFLVFKIWYEDVSIEITDFTVYDTYSELGNAIPKSLLDECAKYLNINSPTRTYEKLDI